MELASRLKGMETSIFSQLADLKKEVESSGKTLVNLSIGSPDLAPAYEIRKILSELVMQEEMYDYTLTRGTMDFREACAKWYKQRFDVDLDPETEVLPVMGSQDGLAHIYWAFLNKGDTALIPDPGYPIYSDGVALAEGIKVPIPLKEVNSFLPDFAEIDKTSARKAKIMILNYPNNPTAAVAPPSFFPEAVRFAQENNIIICHDAAYTELAFEGYRPVSFLETEGAKEVGVEFHSLSKTYNMAGARLGFVVGNADIIKALETIKSNIDYGTFRPILKAGVQALLGSDQIIKENQKVYRRRRDIFVDGCAEVGWKIARPAASMFVWASVPTKQDSFTFVKELAREAGVLVVPGVAFGRYGEGYIRVGLVQKQELIKEAVDRIQSFLNLRD